ncbi:MAG: response regulator transcription factor [Anaerolineae bacterium]|nr:response regulator transcription factor [Anaerolineae bacterium]
MSNTAKTAKNPKTIRVMIADDVTEMRRSTRLMLTAIPNVEIVAIAKDGREAIEMARTHKPDIALMDVNMPHTNGLKAIAAMRAERPDLACIILSAERDTETLLEAMAVGARGYLTKPFTTEQLIETFERVSQNLEVKKRQTSQVAQLRQQRDLILRELAIEYVKQQRTDAKAMRVLEQVTAYPKCDRQLLVALAWVYVQRQEWEKLKELKKRLPVTDQLKR